MHTARVHAAGARHAAWVSTAYVRFTLGFGAGLAGQRPTIKHNVRLHAIVLEHADSVHRIRDVARRRATERQVHGAGISATVQPHVAVYA